MTFSDGSIPIHSSGGLLLIDEDLNILNNINSDDGIQTSTITYSFIDKNDNAYLGTPDGFSKINFDNSLTHYDSRYGIDGYVWAPIKRIDGEIYFGSTKDLYQLKPSYDQWKIILLKN